MGMVETLTLIGLPGIVPVVDGHNILQWPLTTQDFPYAKNDRHPDLDPKIENRGRPLILHRK